MKQKIDQIEGDKWIVLDKEEIRIGFLAQCVEAMATQENCGYVRMLDRLESEDMTQNFILKYYDTLHTQDWDYVVKSLLDLLHRRESQHSDI